MLIRLKDLENDCFVAASVSCIILIQLTLIPTYNPTAMWHKTNSCVWTNYSAIAIGKWGIKIYKLQLTSHICMMTMWMMWFESKILLG